MFADLVDGLLAGLGRVNGWTLSARAGHAMPDRVQKFLNAEVQEKGTRSVGVAHQHCGLTKDVRNCQVMVVLTYAAPGGRTFIDRALYLPESWTADRDRCRAAGVPEEVGFATKPQLGLRMLEDAPAAGVPFSWVAADPGYGRDPGLRAWLHARSVRYMLAVPVDLPLDGPPGKPRQPQVDKAGDLRHYAVSRDPWERRSCGEGSTGQRFYDWTAFEVQVRTGTGARVRAPAADPPLDAEEATGRRPHRLRVRLLPRPRPHRHPGPGDDLPGRCEMADRGGQPRGKAAGGPGRLPGPHLDRLAPPRHLRDARPGLPRRPTGPAPRPRTADGSPGRPRSRSPPSPGTREKPRP